MAVSARWIPDTNVIVRYLVRDIPEQFTQAESWLEGVRTGKGKALFLESVLVECMYVLTKFYGVPKEEAADALAGLLHYKGIINDDKDILLEALALFSGKNLDLVDCMVLARAKNTGYGVMTFDKALKKLAHGS